MKRVFPYLCFVFFIAASIWSAPAGDNRAAPKLDRSLSASYIDDKNTYFDANNLLVFLANNGRLAADQDQMFGKNDGFYFPFTGDVQDIIDGISDKTVIWTAGLWLAGKVDGQVRTALAGYHTPEFVPGPMDNGQPLPDDPSFRVYKIDPTSTTGDPDYDGWPVAQGAPVDSVGNPELLGDQTLWTVYNDAGTHSHPEGGSTAPLGLEIHQKAWGSDEPGLENLLFVQYKLFNRGSNLIDSLFVGFWADMDLGGPSDDLVGSDPMNDLFYCYNGNESDDVYGAVPPAWGCKVLYGLVAPSPGSVAYFDGQPLAGYSNLGLTSFHKLVQGIEPQTARHILDYMKGLDFTTGQPYQDPTTGHATRLFAPGDPVAGTGWIDTEPSELRLMAACGPVVMKPGDSQQVVLAFAATAEGNRLQSVKRLKDILTAIPSVEPAVTVVSPESNESGIPITGTFAVQFDRPMDASSMSESSVVLESRTLGRLPANLTYHNLLQTLIVDPHNLLPWGDEVTLRLTKHVTASNGFPLLDGFTSHYSIAVAGGSGELGPPVIYRVGSGRQSVCAIDIDSDGDCDIVSTSAAGEGIDSTLAVLFNDGAGGFSSPIEYIVGKNPWHVRAADFNGDGSADIVTANKEDSSISILFNSGNGDLGSRVDYRVGQQPSAIAILDADADGDPDLIVANGQSGYLSLLFNDGTGAFTSTVGIETGFGMNNYVAALDLNSDGLDDLVTLSGSVISTFLGQGSGEFRWIANKPTVGFSSSISSADLDGDGSLDLVTEHYHELSISVLFGNGDGTMEQEIVYAVDGNPGQLALGDFDGDGDVDIAVANASGYQITFLPNNGDGSFGAGSSFPAAACTYTMACSDWDRDGDLDLVAGTCNGNISIMLNLGDPTTVANQDIPLPLSPTLEQNYPNPFNPATTIEYSVPTRLPVEIAIFNILGRKVKSLVSEIKSAGEYRIVWNGEDFNGQPVVTGVYFYRLSAGDHIEAKKMLLLK